MNHDQDVDMNNNKNKIAYILWRFPVISETFILNELYFLLKEYPQIDYTLFSIKKPHKAPSHKLVDTFLERDIYVPNLLSFKFIVPIIGFVVHHPFRLMKIIFELVREIPFNISLRLSAYYSIQSAYCLLKGIYLASEMKKRNIGYIHTHYAESSGLISCISSKLAGIPFSLGLHGDDVYFNRNINLVTYLIRSSKFSTMVSQHMKDFIMEMDSMLAGKIHVVYNGINLDLFNINGENTRPQKFTILLVSRLVKGKGIEDLIRVCAGLDNKIDYKCIIVGDGLERAVFEELIHYHGLSDKIELAGYASHEAVVEYYRQASVFILPSYSEGIPNTVKEAMALKIPVISTKIKGIPELVRDGAGILIEPGNLNELESAILNIYHRSENELHEMGIKGRRIIEDYFNVRNQVKMLYEKFNSPL